MRSVLTLIFFLLTLSTLAQNPYYLHYTIGDGLPSDNVYSVFQNTDGVVLFSTDVGVVKYDSKSFSLLNTDNGLSDNEVFRLTIDYKGRIWLHTLNGKPCYIYKGKIYNSKNAMWLMQIKASGYMVDFYEDADSNIYLSYRSGEVYKIDINDRITELKNKAEFNWGVWKGADTLFAVSSGMVLSLETHDTLQSISVAAPYRLCHANYSHYFCSKNRLYIIKNNRLKHLLDVKNGKDITNVKVIKGYLWVTTKEGLYQYDGSNLINHFFADDPVSDIICDKEGNYWVTTLNNGVFLIPSMQVLRILPNKKINVISANNNKLWIGGVNSDYYVKYDSLLQEFFLPDKWPKDKISRFRFYDGRQYIVSKAGIVIKEENREQNIPLNTNDLLQSEDYIYVATTFSAKIRKEFFVDSVLFSHMTSAFLEKRSNVLCDDEAGNIWVGTNFGLYKYAKEGSRFILSNIGGIYPELSVSIEDIFYDNVSKKLIVGTASKGIVLLKEDELISIKTNDGLNSNTVRTIKKIGNGLYLAGTNNGLNVIYDKDSLNVKNCNFQVGVVNKKVLDIEYINGTVYLATDNGVLFFPDTVLIKNDVRPICNITTVTTVKGPYDGKGLKYFENDISISYNGISFKDKGDVDYYYRFKDKDENWSHTKETQVNFKDLSPGKYIFRLYCKNSLGNTSKIQTVSFEILPPFWEQLWFVMMSALLVSGAIIGTVRYNFKKQHAENEAEKHRMQIDKDKVQLEKQMLEMEQKALRMQMNPHFIFNALNTIKGYYSDGDDIKAGNYIAKFSKLLRILLNNEGYNTTLDNEIEMLRLYIELTRLRYNEKFDYYIDVDDNLVTTDILIPVFLLQPIVENAILHGLAPKKDLGILSISFIKKGDKMKCIVIDNGIGRQHAAQLRNKDFYESKAISIVEDRLRLFDDNTSFEIVDLMEDGNATGTKVIIVLPIKYKRYENVNSRR